MPSALILIANGTEEMEFTIPFDTLARAGVDCVSAFVPDASAPPTGDGVLVATGSRGVRFVPDMVFDPAKSGPERYDALIIPGGLGGAETISQTSSVQSLVRQYIAQKRLVGMICAAPLTALTANLPRQPLTSHPIVKARLEKHFDYSEESVVISGTLVTSRGVGTAFPFALTIVELLCGPEKRSEIRPPMMFPDGTPF